MKERQPRKLAVIVHADVVGSTELVRRDDALAHERIRNAFQRFSRTIESYNGHPLELRGDALVAEFDRASDAVVASLAFQAENTRFNTTLEDDIQPAIRVGISLGEVVIADNTITGEGIVLAQRLEQLASSGEVCIQGAVYEAVPRRLPFEYKHLGEQNLKGFSEPVRAHVVRLKPGASAPAPEIHALLPDDQPKRSTERRIVGPAIAVLVIAGSLVFWFKPWVSEEGSMSIERTLNPLPDKPSIAVLPLDNLSGDPDQDYFVDGMTDDLITDLSKVSGLFVIARNSAFAYKGKSINVQQVSKDLGVAYVLEGSARRLGQKVRINVQLIDASTGGHVWAERYDRELKDIFLLQDEVVSEIVSALAVKLSDSEESQLARLPTQNLEAYDYFLRAERGLYSQDSKGLDQALLLYRRATSLDPEFAQAWAGDARAAVDVWRLDWFDVMPGHVARNRAYESAGRALDLDSKSARAYSVLAVLQMVDGRYDDAIDSARKAVSLQPNDADAYLNLALILSYSGQPDEAVTVMRTALRLDPNPLPGVYRVAGLILLLDGQHESAIRQLKKAETALTDAPHEELAMAYAELGRMKEARIEIKGLQEVWPEANLSYYRVLYAHHKREEDLRFRIEALRKAGLPEWPYGFEGREVDRLNGDEIRQLLYGRIWSGYRMGREIILRENTKKGLIIYRDPAAHGGRSRSAYMLIGNATVEGNMLCYQYEQFLLGRKYCGYVYRNAEGSRLDKNEYVDVNAIGIDFFTAGAAVPNDVN